MSTGSSFWTLVEPEFCEESCACQYVDLSLELSASNAGLKLGEEPKVVVFFYTLDQELLLCNEYLATENRLLRHRERLGGLFKYYYREAT